MKKLSLLSLTVVSSVSSFVPTQILNINIYTARTELASVKTDPVDEAIEIYNSRFSFKEEYKSFSFINWGVPRFDIDGTPTSSSNIKGSNGKGKRIFEVGNTQAREAFQELSNIYGAEEALQMTKDMPSILAFSKNNFKPSFVEFGKIFGVQAAKDMIMRNPGLLAIKPSYAAKSDDQTMQLSYVVAKTRPIGGLLLSGTFGLLMIPVIEGISGIPFRENLLQSILKS